MRDEIKKMKDFTLIDKDLVVEGTISSKGEMIIKGTLSGTLTGGDVIISEEGKANAKMDVVRLTIGGSFEGEATVSDELLVLSTGRCKGKVVCKNFTVEKGGFLDAQVTCRQVKK